MTSPKYCIVFQRETKDQNRVHMSNLEQSSAKLIAKKINKLGHHRSKDRVRYIPVPESRLHKYVLGLSPDLVEKTRLV